MAAAAVNPLVQGPEPVFNADRYALDLRALEDYRNFASKTIQRFWRGHAVRRALRRQRDAAAQLAAERAAAERTAALHYWAARTIQDVWRSRRNTRIFSLYRDILSFEAAGDPAAMLRAINPREAALLDAAAGAHVRFRLAGESFPPAIVYKIYTHRPVTDVNAFAPRDYAAEAAAGTDEVDLTMGDNRSADREELRPFARVDGTTGYRSTRGWYRRCDRNGWRPVAPHAVLAPGQLLALAQLSRGLPGATAGLSAGPLPTAGVRQKRRQRLAAVGAAGQEGIGSRSRRSSSAGAGAARWAPPTHFSCLIRRDERRRRAKQRRRDWMLKLYRLGLDEVEPAAQTPHGKSAAAVGTAPCDGSSPPLAGAAAAASEESGRNSPRAGVSAGVGIWAGAVEEDEDSALLEDLERRLATLVRLKRPAAVDDTAAAAASGGGTAAGDAPNPDATGRLQAEEAEVGDADTAGATLLRWCQALDFDAYLAGWVRSACTVASEAAGGAALRLAEAALAAQLGNWEMDGGGSDVDGGVGMGVSTAPAVGVVPFQGGVRPAEGATSGLAVTS